jgi:hypothetical protein
MLAQVAHQHGFGWSACRGPGSPSAELQILEVAECRLGNEGGNAPISRVLDHLGSGDGGGEYLLGGDVKAVILQTLDQHGPGAAGGVGDQPIRNLLLAEPGERLGRPGCGAVAGVQGSVEIEQVSPGFHQGIFPS